MGQDTNLEATQQQQQNQTIAVQQTEMPMTYSTRAQRELDAIMGNGTGEAELNYYERDIDLVLTREEESEFLSYAKKDEPVIPEKLQSVTDASSKFQQKRRAKAEQRIKPAHDAWEEKNEDRRKKFKNLVKFRRRIQDEQHIDATPEMMDEAWEKMERKEFGPLPQDVTVMEEEFGAARDAWADFMGTISGIESAKQCLFNYTTENYKYMNLYLRSKSSKSVIDEFRKEKTPKQLRASIREAEILKEAMNSSVLPRDVVLTRTLHEDGLKKMGLPPEYFDDVTKQENPGDVVLRDDAFCSTAYTTSSFYEEGNNVNMVILAHKGTKGLLLGNFSRFKQEKELLLAPGQCFQLKKVKKEQGVDNDGKPTTSYTVYVEVINDNDSGVPRTE